ncbi:MAG: macro domain-containing protein [Candidatus Woesearchaeota archaeon]|nr:MAG: macro domain-containing protein [Candidatus Woesearchaeota archaeon]
MSTILRNEYTIGKNKAIEIQQGNIVDYIADAIVTPANAHLEIEPQGVSAAILRKSGMEPFKKAVDLAKNYAKEHGFTNVGDIEVRVPLFSAHVTDGGKISQKIIHSVALSYDPKKRCAYCNKEIVEKSVENILKKAEEEGIKSIGIPALGAGVYKVPIEDSVEAIVTESKKHLEGKSLVDRIGIVLYGEDSYNEGKKVCDKLLK